MSTTARLAAAATLVLALAAGCSNAPSSSPVTPSTPGETAGGPAGGQASERPQARRPAASPAPQPRTTAMPTPRRPVPRIVDVDQVDRIRGPRTLGRVLLAAERAVRSPSTRGADLAAAAHVQQRVYRRLSLTPRWRTPVLRSLPAGLRSAARNNIGAGASLSSLVTPQRTLPDWRIVRPPPAGRLLAAYRKGGNRFGIPWQYLAAINLVETRMGRIRGRSTAGAQGPMQFMPATWEAYGRGDVNDPDDAIAAAARYLAAHGAPGDMDDALWNYNHSDRYVEAVSAYARVMIEDPRAFRGYYHWQVYYTMPGGAVHLPVGYGR